MKICTKCKEGKKKSEFCKSIGTYDGLQYRCKSCNKKYRNSHKKEIVKRKALHYIENKAEIDAKNMLYYQENKEGLTTKRSEYARGYRQRNRGKITAKTAKRNMAKVRATPSWLTKEQLLEIEEFYIESARLTKETGISHHVDHIEPVQGKDVCGLHVPWNLQILTASENIKKGNRIIR